MQYTLAIHGGAGAIDKAKLTPELKLAYHQGLKKSLLAGQEILAKGGSAIDASCAAVCALEDNPLFNAGRGAVFTSDGTQEMDAAIMEGSHREAGTVAGLFGPKNPILAARAVMENSDHVFLIGQPAINLARKQCLPFAEKDYFYTQTRWDALQQTLQLKALGKVSDDPAVRHGTVGAVALDANGLLAAATSTGGMTGKAPGRVGDSPLIGCGTFADNNSCAVSATGHGEVFIRYTAAAEVSARMRYLGESVQQAAKHVVMTDLLPNDGTGGLIAIDRKGNIAMPFNCAGMYRGSVSSTSPMQVAIF